MAFHIPHKSYKKINKRYSTMESNRILLIFIFGIPLFPKVYSDIYPSLIIKKTNKNYAVAEDIQYAEYQNNFLTFSASLKYQLYNACPEENAPYRWLNALKVQEPMTDFEAIPLQQFLEGYFPKYNCRNPIRPVVLKSKRTENDDFELECDIGFLIYEWNADFGELWKKYASFPRLPECNFINFLTIKMDRQSGTIKWVRHRIISRGLLTPRSGSNSLPPNETNADLYGFDVNSLYTENNQKKMFFSIFGAFYFRYYNHPHRCLIKVQLAPHADFLLSTWKLPSFMDLNTAAMWIQLYPQWRNVEAFVIGVARDLEPLIVETGTAGILALPIDNDKSRSVYLREEQKSPVPQYIWKVVKFEPSVGDVYTQAILIVMHNDPYTPDQKPICDDVGEDLGWRLSNNDYKTGLTYVCSVHEGITSKLQIEYKGNYESLNLKNKQKLESDKNGIYPPLFVIKKPNNNYAMADKFQYIESENNVLIFATSPEYRLYNACPENNAHFFWKYALQVQELITDFEATALQPFIEGDFVKYKCSNPINPVVLQPKQRFQSIYVLEFHIGFLIHDRDIHSDKVSRKYENFTEIQWYDFLHFLTIRIDMNSGSTLEACHQIVSRGLLELDLPYSDLFQLNEKNFDFYGYDVDYLYTQENQTSVFTSTFPDRYSDYFSYPNKSLRKVQLAPHEDFQLEIWKLPSFMDMNTAAMWEQLYLQWRRIEKFVRKVAQQLGALTIQTGAARVLSITSAWGMQKAVYLHKSGLHPVHRYIWKLIKMAQLDDEVNTPAVLIIMHNDPYSPDQKSFCDDVSENWGWIVSNKDYKTGLTYVCPVDENITKELNIEYKGSYSSLNLNYVQKTEYDRKDTYPSLFIIKKPNNNYTVADKFQYVEGEHNVIKFTTSPENQLYNACPEKNAPFYQTYTLEVQKSVTDFEPRPLEQFVQGDFVNYNCLNPIRPVALPSKQKLASKSVLEYHIGFLIHDTDANFDKLSEKYENFTERHEYDFLPFLTIRIDKRTGSTLEACHQIVSGGLLEAGLPYSDPFQLFEKNFDFYGFDVDYLYTEENQKSVFTSIFPEIYSNFFSYPNQSLRKVQLAPHEDFQLGTWKLPLLMNLNTTAMWEQLYPQWRKIEIFVRQVARKLGGLTIVTGASKVLAFRGIDMELKHIFLHNERKFPVHRYIWKLITFRQSNDDRNTQAVLIVMHNNPYIPNEAPICDDVSENLGWMVSNNDYRTGLTYVCPVHEDIMFKLYAWYKGNYESLNLNNVQKL